MRLRWLQRRSDGKTEQPAKRYRPLLEPLECRCLPSSYTVNTTNDILHDTTPGEVTLRDVLTAIDTQAASGNAAAGTAANIIQFAIGGQGSVATINVGSGNTAGPLPVLTHQAIIDGWSQGEGANVPPPSVGSYTGPPLIVLNGFSAGNGANGLELDAGSDASEVRGLVIQQFTGNGIEIKGSNNNSILGNYIGTDQTGTVLISNGIDGIRVDGGASGNTIGGTAARLAERHRRRAERSGRRQSRHTSRGVYPRSGEHRRQHRQFPHRHPLHRFTAQRDGLCRRGRARQQPRLGTGQLGDESA